jgi:hypothetical protein
MNKDKNISLLNEELQLLKKSLFHLQGSFEKCNKINLNAVYTFEELESFDSLTSRFVRSADIYTQKVLRTIFLLLREDIQFFADRMYKAEKEGIICNSDKLLEIKDLRNDIVHQYIPEATIELIREVLEFTSVLFENIGQTEKYLNRKNWLIA